MFTFLHNRENFGTIAITMDELSDLRLEERPCSVSPNSDLKLIIRKELFAS